MKVNKTNVISQINKLKGNLSAVARSFGKSRGWIYLYIERHDLHDVVEEARETMIDNVESALYSQALAGNTTAMIFFLKTQGKSRGYTERQETELSTKDDKPIFIVNDGSSTD